MKKDEPKLLWHTLLNLYLWHRYPQESLVTDDTAFVAASRLRDFCDEVIASLADPEPESER